MQPLVVAVVLNWNLPMITSDCIDSLLRSDYGNLSVLIVDNGSSDDSVSLLTERFGNLVTILETGRNLLFAGGSNAGLRWAHEAGADFCLVVNNDTLIASDTVRLLVETAVSWESVGVVSPVIYSGVAGRRIWSLGGTARRWVPFPRELSRGRIDRGQFTKAFPVDFVTGCAMLISRDIIDTVGVFDTSYQMYFEDADYCLRVRRAGYQIIVEPAARVWHRIAESSKSNLPLFHYQRARFRLRFYMTNYQGITGWIALVVVVTQEVCRASSALLRGRLDVATALLRGLRDGLIDWST